MLALDNLEPPPYAVTLEESGQNECRLALDNGVTRNIYIFLDNEFKMG